MLEAVLKVIEMCKTHIEQTQNEKEVTTSFQGLGVNLIRKLGNSCCVG